MAGSGAVISGLVQVLMPTTSLRLVRTATIETFFGGVTLLTLLATQPLFVRVPGPAVMGYPITIGVGGLLALLGSRSYIARKKTGAQLVARSVLSGAIMAGTVGLLSPWIVPSVPIIAGLELTLRTLGVMTAKGVFDGTFMERPLRAFMQYPK